MCMCIFYASLRLWAYCHGIRTTVDYMWIPACLGVKGKRKIHAYFAQSAVQEPKGCNFCSSLIQVRWKLVGSLPAVLISYIISLFSSNWYLRNWRGPGDQLVSKFSSSTSAPRGNQVLKTWLDYFLNNNIKQKKHRKCFQELHFYIIIKTWNLPWRKSVMDEKITSSQWLKEKVPKEINKHMKAF